MWAKVLKIIALSKGGIGDIVKKFTKTLVIIVISPFVAITFLIGGIFADGISFNHNLVFDLFSGNPITDYMEEQAEFIKEIQNGLALLDVQMKSTNERFTNGSSVNAYQVKGYYIGLMFTLEKIQLDEPKAELWVKSFTEEISENEEIKLHPTSVNQTIYTQLNQNLALVLNAETRETMEKVYGSLIGNDNGTVTTLSKEEIDKLLKNLPKDTSELRKNIIIQAVDAVGKIPYYWGGFATLPGYEGNDFGKIISPDENGRNRKGLDCSHFVDWVYWTVMGNNLGNTNTTGQIKMCKKISVSELQVGDLAFLMDKNGNTTHVGIYAGINENGENIWVHENANDNNVAINTVSYWSGYYRLNIMVGK